MHQLIRSVRRLRDGFTLIELLTVMAVVAILTGIIISIYGLINKHAAATRADGEIQTLESALESYKTDHGAYPHQPLAVSGSIPPVITTEGQTNVPSDLLDPRTNGNSQSNNATYANASLELYEALTGDLSLSGTGGGPGVTNYIRDMRQDVYGRYYSNAPVSGTNPVTYLSDPFGNCYGYSTANSTAITTGSAPYPGFNSTYDLWSTGGQAQTPYNGGTGSPNAPGAPGDPMLQWVKNW
jgi:prepilin-type N-terminal cleavage/methylation domain-containing protein